MKIKNLKINFQKLISIGLVGSMTLCPIVASANEIIVDNPTKIFMTYEKIDAFDQGLAKSGAVSQKNKLWKDWPYTKYGYQTRIGDAGCSPLSITNALVLAFGINNKEDITNILKNVIAFDSKYKGINNYFVQGKINKKYKAFNNLMKQNIINIGSNAKIVYQTIQRHSIKEDDYYFGTLSFADKTYGYILKIINELYQQNPDTNVIFYNMTSGYLGLERPFGSQSNSGHYVTLMLNVKEFVENNAFYLIDSVPRNLFNEKNHHVNYNFVEKPKMGKLEKFNRLYNVKRINEQILKITKKDGKIDTDSLKVLGLDGGCGIIICPDNISIKEEYQVSDSACYDFETNKVYVKKRG